MNYLISISNLNSRLLKSINSPFSSVTVILIEEIYFPLVIFFIVISFGEHSTLSNGFPSMSKQARIVEGFPLNRFSSLSIRSQFIK